jgi:hypothetical protein
MEYRFGVAFAIQPWFIVLHIPWFRVQAEAAAAAAVERADRFERDAGLSAERGSLIHTLRKEALKLHTQVREMHAASAVKEDQLSALAAEVAGLQATVKRLTLQQKHYAASAKVHPPFDVVRAAG